MSKMSGNVLENVLDMGYTLIGGHSSAKQWSLLTTRIDFDDHLTALARALVVTHLQNSGHY